jgi:hypothetical protein
VASSSPSPWTTSRQPERRKRTATSSSFSMSHEFFLAVAALPRPPASFLLPPRRSRPPGAPSPHQRARGEHANLLRFFFLPITPSITSLAFVCFVTGASPPSSLIRCRSRPCQQVPLGSIDAR